MKKTVTALFTRQDSIYKTLGIECYDIERDALTWEGGNACIAHPPCRAWGRLRKFAKPRPGEKELAIWAVEMVRENGGVLEHPESSTLWKELQLPKGSERDKWGGYTLSIDQHWFGHEARKRTWLYIAGCAPKDIPPYDIMWQLPGKVVSNSKRKGETGWRPELAKSERERTPPKLAKWLIETARRC